MKVSSGWIKECLGRTIFDDQKVVQGLERSGMEIESIISSSALDKSIVVCTVKKVIQHPRADRLRICEVETDKGSYQIVCGAPNVRPGIKAALAQMGSLLPAGEKIARVKLRGEASEGMLCSARELGLGKDHNGIIELSNDVENGTPVSEIFPADTIIDLKTPANRWDVLSVYGLAREVAAMENKGELSPLPKPIFSTPANGPDIKPNSKASRFMLAKLQIDHTSLSPRQIKTRLESAGVRSISPVVDITNYVMLEVGQPLHAYDAAKVKLPIEVRYAVAGETLTTLDGVKRKLTTRDLVIADKSGPIGLAGVMGGASTEVSDATREILLEAAVFSPVEVRKAAQRHGLRSEASARFERGLPIQLPPIAMARAIQLLEEHADGKLVGNSDQLNEWPWVGRIGLRVSKLNQLLGFGISHKEALKALGQLGISGKDYDIAQEAKALLDRPYKYGASFKNDGTAAFDCSYLVDYLYSLIGLQVGFTALGQFETGRSIPEAELVPGDALFTEGHNDKVAGDHFYRRDDEGHYIKVAVAPQKRIGHVGLYVGDGKVIHASSKTGKVVIAPLTDFTKDPTYKGARRFADDLGDFISVPEVPWWRPDLRLPEDLVEEIVRVLGYNRVPSTIPWWKPKKITFDRVRSQRRRVRDMMYAAGLFEVVTYSFVSEAQIEMLGLDPDKHEKLRNPLSLEQAYLRSSLLPSHLSVAAANRSYSGVGDFYEISKVFIKRGNSAQPSEPQRLGVSVVGDQSYQRAKGILDALAYEANLTLEVAPANAGKVYAKARVGQVRLGGKTLGVIGQIHPQVLHGLKIEKEMAHIEVDLDPLLSKSSTRAFEPMSRFPRTTRDLTMLVRDSISWQGVREVLGHYNVDYVGEYIGTELPAGHKTLTIRITVSAMDHTPTEAEAVVVETDIKQLLERRLGARER
jgi:phenylalanyl-tRNA synthetase beta subunit